MRITIHWSAFDEYADQFRPGTRPGVTKTFDTTVTRRNDDKEMLELLFEATNLYTGPLWDAMQPLPEDRSHTALSVGDVVELDGTPYRCATFGWSEA